MPGVLDTDVGYTGGWLENPTYDDTHDSKSGHAEAVRISFDPSILSYEDLLEKWFFKLHDPTTLNRQGLAAAHHDDDRARLDLVQRRGLPPGLPAKASGWVHLPLHAGVTRPVRPYDALDEPAVLIEVDFQGETAEKFRMPEHRKRR